MGSLDDEVKRLRNLSMLLSRNERALFEEMLSAALPYAYPLSAGGIEARQALLFSILLNQMMMVSKLEERVLQRLGQSNIE